VARRFLRRLRLAFFVLLFAVVLLGFYLNKAGLPDFVKEDVVARLRARGWDVEFSRLRLRWHRGVVAEDLHIQKRGEEEGPQCFIDEAQLRLDHAAFLKFQIQVDALVLHGGRFLWTFAVTNLPRQTVQLNQMNGVLRFLPGDRWQLDGLQARCLGAHLTFDGVVTNVAAVRDWKWPRTQGAKEPGMASWPRIVERLRNVQFEGAPEVQCRFEGDAAHPRTFHGTVGVTAPGLQSPWGSGTNIVLSAQWFPSSPPDTPVQAEVNLAAAAARSPWGEAEHLRLYLHCLPSLAGLVPTNVNVAVQLQKASTRWGRVELADLTLHSAPDPEDAALRQTVCELSADDLVTSWGASLHSQFNVSLRHALSRYLPLTWSGTARLLQARSDWGEAEGAVVEGSGFIPVDSSLGRTNLTWPERLAGLRFQASSQWTNLITPKLRIDEVSVTSAWESPRLETRARGAMADGEFTVRAGLETENRQLVFSAVSSIDPRGIVPLLTTNGQRWLNHYTWESPPRAQLQGSVILPAWTNRHPDWRGEVRPTLTLAGNFEVGPAGYRGVPFSSARSPFTLTNLVWHLTDLEVTRPEGYLKGEYISHMGTRDFHWRLATRAFPQALRPLVETKAQERALGFFEFTRPPEVEGEIFGNWGDVNRLGFAAHVEATNFVFRGESVRFFASDVSYTNRQLSCYHPRVQRTASESAAASGVGIDFTRLKLYLTNAFGRLTPESVTRVISAKAFEVMQPYRFEEPPLVHVDGIVDIKRKRHEYDLEFEVSGGPFHWKRFNFEEVQGRLRWLGDTLTMSNVQGRLYGGAAHGGAWFDFSPDPGALFGFQSHLTNVNFHTFTEDLSGKTNKLEGVLSGDLTVTNASTADWNSWQGHGRVELRDGLIWDIPVFGVFSPILNAIVPGLGNSRAREASAAFVITNSVVQTHDLEVRATAMRMQFRGQADLQRRINGRMEAELLRDMPAVGLLLSKVLWPVTKLFEYKVSGTLAEPKTESVYIIPKIVLLPFNPLKSLREIFQLAVPPPEPDGPPY
jgi:AsmA-like C-terminal region